jgi:bidirectional [NiFe] hydrogenase diaphorase subunit
VQSALEQELGIKAGETRADGQASLQIARCLGTCGLAPLAIFDSTVAGNVTAERARDHVKGWVTDGTR